jgi:hypothetical protein
MQVDSVLRLAILSKFDKAKTGADLLTLLDQLLTTNALPAPGAQTEG